MSAYFMRKKDRINGLKNVFKEKNTPQKVLLVILTPNVSFERSLFACFRRQLYYTMKTDMIVLKRIGEKRCILL